MKLASDIKQRCLKLNQVGSINKPLVLAILVFSLFGSFRIVQSHADAADPKVISGLSGYCLDDHDSSLKPDAVVDAWKCNDSVSQVWTVRYSTISHDDNYCLSVENDATSLGSPVVLNSCDNAPGQIWLRDNSGYQNPNSGLCLSTAANKDNGQLVIASCNDLAKPNETWTPVVQNTKLDSADQSCTGTEDDKIACYAIKEWTSWQSGSPNHNSLLNTYTDGAPYEEWCADFVSYVYKEAGYPFTQGETNGWDESNANNIQYMGVFTQHWAASGYVPKTGDVAFFDYPGGHVELVVSGGKKPTFVYGNSGVIDPTTGNGEMEANTLTSDGSLGQVLYYLSPSDN